MATTTASGRASVSNVTVYTGMIRLLMTTTLEHPFAVVRNACGRDRDMSRRTVVFLTFAAILLSLTSCGGDDSDDALQPLGQSLAADALAVGKVAEVGDLRVVVTAIASRTTGQMNSSPSPPLTRWILVSLRVENPTSEEQLQPDINLFCGTQEFGRYLNQDPNAYPSELALKPKTFAEGVMLFGAPTTCPNGFIKAARLGLYYGKTNTATATWAIPTGTQ